MSICSKNSNKVDILSINLYFKSQKKIVKGCHMLSDLLAHYRSLSQAVRGVSQSIASPFKSKATINSSRWANFRGVMCMAWWVLIVTHWVIRCS